MDMTKLLDVAFDRVRGLTEEDQNMLASALISMVPDDVPVIEFDGGARRSPARSSNVKNLGIA